MNINRNINHNDNDIDDNKHISNLSIGNSFDRRRYARFVLDPGYAPVSIRLLDSDRFDIEANALDLSETGIRFESDRPIEPGSAVAMQITLPADAHDDPGPGRSIFVFANIVWLADDEDELAAGFARQAAVFTRFARAGDRERLLKRFGTGRYRIAA